MPNFTICQSISNGFFIIFYVLFLSFVTAIPHGGVWVEKRRFCEAKIGAFGVFCGGWRYIRREQAPPYEMRCLALEILRCAQNDKKRRREMAKKRKKIRNLIKEKTIPQAANRQLPLHKGAF